MAGRLTIVRGPMALLCVWLPGFGALRAQDPYPEPDPAIYGQWSHTFNLWRMYTTQDCIPGPGVQPCDEIAGVTLVSSGEKAGDRKSTRLNSSHLGISYAV